MSNGKSVGSRMEYQEKIRRVSFKESFTSSEIRRLRLVVKLRFRELYDSKLSGLGAFDNIAIY